MPHTVLKPAATAPDCHSGAQRLVPDERTAHEPALRSPLQSPGSDLAGVVPLGPDPRWRLVQCADSLRWFVDPPSAQWADHRWELESFQNRWGRTAVLLASCAARAGLPGDNPFVLRPG